MAKGHRAQRSSLQQDCSLLPRSIVGRDDIRTKAVGVVIGLVAMLAASVKSMATAKPMQVLLLVTGDTHDVATVRSTLQWILTRYEDTRISAQPSLATLTPQALQDSDVVLLFAPNVGLNPEQKSLLQAFLQRGGGVVYVHTLPDTESTAEATPSNQVVQVRSTAHPTSQQLRSFQVTDAPLPLATTLPKETRVIAHLQDGSPVAWVEMRGKSRVFVTRLGHSPAVWEHSVFQKMLVNAVYWCAGRKPPQPSVPRAPKGFVSLFNGVNLEGWGEVGSPCWSVQDGVIQCSGRGEGGGWLKSNRMYRDFVLRLEYRISAGGNSGIFLRAPHFGRSSRLGFELQILDDKGTPPSNTCTAAVYAVMPPRLNPAKPAGEWNQVEIMLKGRHLRVVWNGYLVHDIDLDEPTLNANLPRTHLLHRRPNWGYIGLQNHRSLVEFRNIFIQEL